MENEWELVTKDVGFCRIVWRIKKRCTDGKLHWIYYCDQQDDPQSDEWTFYKCSPDHEPEYKVGRPDYLPEPRWD